MKSSVIKRSVVIGGHKTSVSLEDPFWQKLKEIARRETMTLSSMVSEVENQPRHGNLSSALRMFVLDRMLIQETGFPKSTFPAVPVQPLPNRG